MKRLIFCSVMLVAVAVGASSCHKQGRKAQGPEVLRVEAARAVGERVVVPMRFRSLLYSNYDATIQPRVNGYLLTKQFTKGLPVEKGQVLFTIDASAIELSVLSNRAALASAKTAFAEADNNYRRAIPLARIEAISQSALDQYRAAYASAEAQVRLAESQLNESLLQQGYTTITAPISGIIDDTGATVGDWVGVGTEYSVLATISNTEQMGVHIQIPFARYYELRGGVEGERPSYDNSTLLSNIRLYLPDGTLYPYEGTYSYTKRDAGDQTGTIIIVASFPNPERALKIGGSVVVVADVGSPEGVVMVPQQAVVQTLDKAHVWVVGSDNTVAFRPVVVGAKFGDHWIVEEGLKAGEMVVTAGGQKLRSGARVTVDNKSAQQ